MSNGFARYDELHLPPLSGISDWGQTFTKLFLLPLGFFLLVRLSCLLFRTGTRRRTTDQCDKERRDQNRPGKQLFHTGDRNRTIIRAINAATSRHRCPTVGEAGLFNFGDVVFVYCLLAVLVLERFQAFQDLIQRKLVLQIDLIVNFCAQPVFVRLAILPIHANVMFIHTQTLTRTTAAIINFQLPPNSAMRSAARSARVSCAASSTLTLRVAECRKSSSVWRNRLASAVSISSATFGLLRTKERKCTRESTASRASSATRASAERGLPSNKAISPKKSPRLNSVSVTSCPSLIRTQIRTFPSSIIYIASPASPVRKRTAPALASRLSSSSHNSLAASVSSDSNNGT